MTTEICRFAPTTSGRAHPGTLLAGMLAWLDAKSRKAKFILRMEDIDPDRVHDKWRTGLLDDLEWFGLTWDEIVWQSECKKNHDAVMDILCAKGLLFSCSCTRGDLKRANIPSVAGGFVYPGTCRSKRVHDWRSCVENIRCDMSGQKIMLLDESGLDLSQDVESAMGDPVVRRRDGSFTYQLAVVADDNASGVTRIVRGRDIADSTATQVALYRMLDFKLPKYRHHFLLLEPRGEKFAKFHGAVGSDVLKKYYSADELRGILANIAGLHPDQSPVTMERLLQNFSWEKVETRDRVLSWEKGRLKLSSVFNAVQ